MLKIYILEGADRVGKSTLAAKLANALQVPVAHFGKPDSQLQAERGHNYQYEYLLNSEHTHVLDRSWISGMFYDVMRRQTQANLKSAQWLTWQLLEVGFEINVIFVNRLWNQSLIKGHTEEITQGLGYGSLQERYIEHHLWPEYLSWLAPQISANFWYAHENILSDLLEYDVYPPAGPHVSQFSSQLLRAFVGQTERGFNPTSWAREIWDYTDANRIKYAIGRINQANYKYP